MGYPSVSLQDAKKDLSISFCRCQGLDFYLASAFSQHLPQKLQRARFARFVRAQLTAEGTREDGFLHQVDACQGLLRYLLGCALTRQQVVDEAHDFVLFGEGWEQYWEIF